MDTNKTFAVYLGHNNDTFSTGFVVENDCFAVLEIKDKDAEAKLRLTTEDLRNVLKDEFITTPFELKKLAETFIEKHKLNSLAIGCFYKDQLINYSLKAAVLLLRQGRLYYASEENTALVGKFASQDLFLFCDKNITQLLIPKPATIPSSKEPKIFIEEFKNKYSPEQGVLLVVKTVVDNQPAQETKEPEITFPEAEPVVSSSLLNKPTLGFKITEILKNFSNYKWLKLAVFGLVLLLILVPSYFTINRFLAERRVSAFNSQLAQLQQNYSQLEKDLQKNPTQAVKQIEVLKTELSTLASRYPTQNKKTDQLKQKLNILAKNYGNAQITKEEVFFDLSLISKQAAASYLDVTEEYLSLLDTKNKQVYLINIQNKKVQEISYNRNLNAKLVTEYNQSAYLYDPKQGIYKEDNDQFKKIISQDKQWGTIIDLDVFNSNIYLLSQTKDEIFKFTPTEDGYSSKLSYFQSGQSLDLEKAKNMCIDFSIYLLGEKIYKYTAGSFDDFNNPPQLNYQNLTQLYKNPKTDFIYLLDKGSSRVVALNKDGKIIKSIFNPLLKTTDYFGVYQDELIIFLRQNKLYKLDNF